MKKVLISILLFLSVSYISAQNMYWNTYAGACTDIFSAITVHPAVTASQWTRGAGACTSNTTGFSVTGYNQIDSASATASDHYLETTLTETAGLTFQLDSFVWIAYRSGTGPTNMIIQYSVNGAPFINFGSVTGIVSTTTYPFALPIPAVIPAFGNIRIRMYAWGSGAVGTMRLVQGSYAHIITCIEPTLATNVTDVLCNADSTGAIDLIPTGGTGPFTYSWNGPGGYTATSEDILNVPAGTYTVTVTAVGGCTTSTTSVISEPAALNLSATHTNADCNGANNGSIDLTVSGGVLTYSYDWSNGAITEDITGLASGTYSITVTDGNGCVSSDSVIVGEPNILVLTFSQVNPTCAAVSNGSIDLSVSGGTPIYSYLWSNTATTEDIGALSNGNYSVVVTDGNGCTADTSVNLFSSTDLNLSATWTNAFCNGGNDATIDLTVNSGLPLFSYAWSNSATTEDLSGITAGAYSVVVTDAIGCTGSHSLMIGEAALINSSISVSACDFYVSPSGLYTYTTTGLYADTLVAANGCDSLIGISVTIYNTNVGVTINGQIFQADQLGAQYQWVDCNNSFAPIAGATSSNYFTAINGDFAVIITENGCTDTSACYSIEDIGFENYNLNASIELYPNPNNGTFNISIDGLEAEEVFIDILDISGKLVHHRVAGELSGSNIISFALTDLSEGVYFLRMNADGGYRVLRFIKTE